MAGSGIQFNIDAQNRAGAAVDQAIRQQERLGENIRRLKTDSDRLSAAFLDVQRRLEAQAGPMGSVIHQLGRVNIGAGLAAGAVGAFGAAMIAGARQIADYQEQLDLTAAATGLTTGQLAGLRVAASESGRTFEQIQPSLAIFTRTLGDAAAGNEQAVAAFKRLGVAVKIGDQVRDTGDVLRDVQNALRNTTSESERLSMAFDVFGRGAASSLTALLTPLDEAEARARKLGLALGPSAEAAARQADRAFDQLSTSLLGLRNSFGLVAAQVTGPFLTALARAATEAAKLANSPGFQHLFGGALMGGAAGFIPRMPMGVGGGDGASATPYGPLPLTGGGGGGVDARAYYKGPWTDNAMFEASLEPFIAAERQVRLISERFTEFNSITSGTADRIEMAASGSERFGGTLGRLDEAFEKARHEAELLEKQLKQMLSNLVSGGLTDMIFGGGSVWSFLGGLSQGIVRSGFDFILNNLFGGLFGGLQGGGMIKPIRAQTGLMVGGVPGMDSVPVLAQPGEMFVSKRDTDNFGRLVSKMDAFMAAQSMARPAAGARPVNVTLNVSGQFVDERGLRSFASEKLAPMIRSILERGELRGY